MTSGTLSKHIATREVDGQVVFAPPCGERIVGPDEADTYRAIRRHGQGCAMCANASTSNLGA
jgi:hypothetical protein